MAYTFQPAGARESDVLSGDLVSHALNSYDKNRRRQFQFDEELQRSLAAQEEAKQQQEEARRSRNYTWDSGAMQDPAGMQRQQQGQMPINAQMSNQDMSDYFQGQPDIPQPNLGAGISNQMNAQGRAQDQDGRPPLMSVLSHMKDKGLKPEKFSRDGMSYYNTPFGEYEIGRSDPTDFDKELGKANVEQIKDIDKAYSAVSGVLESARHLQEITEDPGFDKAFSSNSSDWLRWMDNKWRWSMEDGAADIRTRFGNTAKSMVLAMTKEIKGNLTNRELGFLESTKPNLNDTPGDIRSKLGNIIELGEKSKQRLSLQRKLMEQGLSIVDAIEMSEEMIYGPKEGKKKSKEVTGKVMPEDDISQDIASAMGGNAPGPEMSQSLAPQDNGPGMSGGQGQSAETSNRDAIMKAMSSLPAGALENMLYGAGEKAMGALGKAGSAASYLTKDVPQMALDSFNNFGKGMTTQALQTSHNMSRAAANAPLELYDYMNENTGDNKSMRLQSMDWANKNPETTAELAGQYLGASAPIAAAGLLGEAATAGLMGAMGAGAGAPFANYMRRILSTGAVGGVEGALLGEEGSRLKSGAIGAATGTVSGTIFGAMEYFNRLGFKNVADKVAKSTIQAEAKYGAEIGKLVQQGEASGINNHLAKVPVPDILKSSFENEMHAVKMFNKAPTLTNMRAAISATSTALREIGKTGENTLRDVQKQALIKLNTALRTSMGNGFSAVNLPGRGELLEKTLKAYGDNVIPLSTHKAIKSYLNTNGSNVYAKEMIEKLLKDNITMDILKKEIPELANIVNSRIAKKAGVALAGVKTAYEALPHAYRAITE